MKRPQSEAVRPADSPGRPEGVRVGRVTHVDAGSQVFVDYAGNEAGPVAARFTSSVGLPALRRAAATGQEVLLAFEGNDPLRPVVIDTLSSLIDEIAEAQDDPSEIEAEGLKDVTVDGRKITFEAEEEVVIRCGKGSITLRKDGKIIVRGTDLLSRSSGPHRIKGASVNIN